MHQLLFFMLFQVNDHINTIIIKTTHCALVFTFAELKRSRRPQDEPGTKTKAPDYQIVAHLLVQH